MSPGGGTAMAPNPNERYLQQERQLHLESLAVERFGFRTAGAVFRARLSLRAILVLTVTTGLLLVFLGAGQRFSVVVGLVLSVSLAGALAYISWDYRREIRSADQELRRALSSAGKYQHTAEAHDH